MCVLVFRVCLISVEQAVTEFRKVSPCKRIDMTGELCHGRFETHLS